MSNVEHDPAPKSPSAGEGDPVAPPGAAAEILVGGNQAAWLSAVTLIAVLGLVLAVVALFRSSGETTIIQGGGRTTEASFVGTEFAFSPSTASLVAGVPLTLELDNQGAVTHELVILTPGTVAATEAEIGPGQIVDRIAEVAAGKKGSLTVTLEAGTYPIVCLLPGHLTGGMKGTIDVG